MEKVLEELGRAAHLGSGDNRRWLDLTPRERESWIEAAKEVMRFARRERVE